MLDDTPKFARRGFRRDFPCNRQWRGRTCATRQVEVIAAAESSGWMVIIVPVTFFQEKVR